MVAIRSSLLQWPLIIGGPALPALVQQVTSTADPQAQANVTGDDWQFQLPNAVQAGNCLKLAAIWPSGSTPTISDPVNGTWPAAVVTADAGAGNCVAGIFVLPNANAGKTLIKAHFGTSVQPFSYEICEWWNVDTVSPVNGTSSAANQSGASIACGSFTPTVNNDANGGNLIYSFFGFAPVFTSNSPSLWTAGSGQTLLHADIGWRGFQGCPKASQYLVQTTQAAINPGVTLTNTAGSYNCVAVALKAASAGHAKPASGIYINKIIAQGSVFAGTSGYNLQFPAVGNLRILVGLASVGLTSITDNDTGSKWQGVAGLNHDLWFCPNRGPKPDLDLVLGYTGGAPGRTTFFFYDVSGAAVSPFDTSTATGLINLTGQTTASNAPIFTPGTSNGLVIATGFTSGGDLTTTGTGVTGPSGALWDLVVATLSNNSGYMSEGDYLAHFYNPNVTDENWNWTQIPGTGTFNAGFDVVSFKGA